MTRLQPAMGMPLPVVGCGLGGCRAWTPTPPTALAVKGVVEGAALVDPFRCQHVVVPKRGPHGGVEHQGRVPATHSRAFVQAQGDRSCESDAVRLGKGREREGGVGGRRAGPGVGARKRGGGETKLSPRTRFPLIKMIN